MPTGIPALWWGAVIVLAVPSLALLAFQSLLMRASALLDEPETR